jgi:hypothetical protein
MGFNYSAQLSILYMVHEDPFRLHHFRDGIVLVMIFDDFPNPPHRMKSYINKNQFTQLQCYPGGACAEDRINLLG